MLIDFFDKVGKKVISFLSYIGGMVILSKHTLVSIFSGSVSFKTIIEQMSWLGVKSFPVTSITAVFVGMVFALQIVSEFSKLGAVKMVGGIVGLALWRELAPMLTGVVLAGRIGAAITAEIGSMKVTEQIEAMESMGTDPIDYIVSPRILSCLFMFPILIIYADVVGFLGAFMITVLFFNVNYVAFLSSAQQFLGTYDIWPGIFIKAPIFGLLIAIICCYCGLNTEKGAKGVGDMTTRSVVISLVTIFIVNYFLSELIY